MDKTPSQNGVNRAGDPYIGEYPGVCGGYPVIERMRFPVRIVVEAYRELGDVAKIAEIYTQLTKAQIQCALDYYAAHPARVDEDIERHERAYAEAHGLPWPA
jgi:uncharacterized protein (DUF433 family)